jgi:hypothetical protein
MASSISSPKEKAGAKTGKGVADTTAANKVTVNGLEVDLRTVAETKFEEVLILHQKGDRASLDKKSRLALIEKATERSEATFFKEVTLALDTETRLDDCYSINRTILNVQERHQMYDMHDVFTVVVPQGNNKTLTKTVYNLYTDYASVTPAMVARSNVWYNTWPSAPTWRENLAWTDRFFKNNVAVELSERVNEVYMSYPNEAKGGPLFFVIMMELLLSQTEEAVIALQAKLKKMDLKSIPGENVERAVSLSRAALVRLETFGKVPDDIIRILLRIFQTSSVPAFNEFFHHLEQQRKIEQAMSTTKVDDTKVTAQSIFRAAGLQYRSLWEENLWTGVRTTGGTSTFSTTTNSAGKSPISKCWNCGDTNHGVSSCPKPKNASKIAEGKKAFKKALKKTKESGGDAKSTTAKSGTTPPTSTSKWRPPTPEENNRRTIDGRAMFWSHKTKRWYPDRNSTDVAPTATAAVATPTMPTSIMTTPTANTVSVGQPPVEARIQATKVAFANAYATVMQQLDQAGI